MCPGAQEKLRSGVRQFAADADTPPQKEKARQFRAGPFRYTLRMAEVRSGTLLMIRVPAISARE
jgi:hypothetical protein